MKVSSLINTHYALFTWLIIGLAFCLRLVLINQSFWLDEAAQALESVRPLSQQLNIKSDFQPPLFHLVVHFISSFSHQEWWLRTASLLPALITIWISMKLGELIGGKKVALLTGLILATSQFHVFYSQELRPYSLATMWAVLSMYRYLIMMQTKRIDWVYVLTTTAGLYSVYTFIFLILAQLLTTGLIYRPQLKHHFQTLLLVILFCLPWLPSFIGQLRTGLQLAQSLPGWSVIVSPPWYKALLLIPPKFIFGRLDLPSSAALLIVITGFIFTYFYLMLKAGKNRHSLITWIWLAAPPIFVWLVSLFIPLLEPKRVLFSLPALALLLSQGIIKLPKPVFGLIFICLVNLLSLSLYWLNPDLQREPWRQAVSDLETLASTQSAAIFPWHGVYAPYAWYAQKDLYRVVFEEIPIRITTLDPKLKALAIRSPDKIIVFEYLMDLTDPERLILSELNSRGFRLTDTLQYPGIGRIYIYIPDKLFANAFP